MRIILAILMIGATFAGCNIRKGYNTDREMYLIANEMYQEYLFEFAIDSTLYQPLVIRDRDDSTKIYRWTAVAPNGDTAGVDITVSRSKEIEPELAEFGSARVLIALTNTKHSKKEWIKK